MRKVEAIIVTDGSWACSVSPSSTSSHSMWSWMRRPDAKGIGMRRIEAVIKPFKVAKVRERLAAAGVLDITLTEVGGLDRGAECAPEAAPSIKLEIVVRDDQVQKAIEAIEVGATTGTVGDGKIFVLPLGDAIRVRTDARNGDAS